MSARDAKGADRGRWRLVGNAVSVPVAEWLATRLFDPASEEVEYEGSEIRAKHVAAFGGPAMPTRYIQGLGEGPASTHQSSVADFGLRSEERTSELQSLMRISYAVFCLKKKK